MTEPEALGAQIIAALDQRDDAALQRLAKKFTPQEWGVIANVGLAYNAIKEIADANAPRAA